MSDLPPATRPTLDARPRKRWVQPVLIAVILLVVAIGAWLAWDWTHTSSPAVQAAKAAKAKGGRFGPAGAVQPVSVAAAKTGDINVVQTGLGTVLAARTSTVHARVDGLLEKVAFKEGDLVQPGAFLAQIDPAPFRSPWSRPRASSRATWPPSTTRASTSSAIARCSRRIPSPRSRSTSRPRR